MEYQVLLPDYLDDFIYGEVEGKGWFDQLLVETQEATYRLTFFDPTRLGQDTRARLKTQDYWFEQNLVVIEMVTLPKMLAAIEELSSLEFQGLVAEIVKESGSASPGLSNE